MTSALRNRVKLGSCSASLASNSKKSHCGTIAMCLWGPGRWFIRSGDAAGIQLHGDLVDEAPRQRGEGLAEAQLVQQRQGGGVHRVAPEVAQEIGVLLEHGDPHPGPGQQQPQPPCRRGRPDKRCIPCRSRVSPIL